MLKFTPHYVPKPWGGRRLESKFGRDIPEGNIGESWELSDVADVTSVVIDGDKAGQSLKELWASGGLGGNAQGDFPFLVKWLDTSERMSAQVHPDEEFCRATQCGAPKTEAWLVAELEPKSKLLIGNYPGLDPQTLVQSVNRGSLEKWMYESLPRAGDMFLLEAGTLHSVGAGFLILEVQQPSDVTFRLYDWGREDENGETRELHSEQAAAAIHYHRFDLPRPRRNEVVGPSFKLKTLSMGTIIPADELRVFVGYKPEETKLLAEGQEFILKYGDILVGEPSDGPISVAFGNCVLLSEPPQ